MRCEGTAVLLAGLGSGAAQHPPLARHVATCLRCQAEQARYRRLLRLLAQLRLEQAALPPGALASVVDAIGLAAEQHAVEAAAPGCRLARGASAAGAVLAATVVLLAARARLARQGASASRCYR